MLRILLLVACIASLAAKPCRGEIVAYWDFNSFDTSDETISADAGAGIIDLTGWNGGISSFSGTTLNSLDDDSGSSLTLRGGSEIAGNGSFIEIYTSLSGLQNPIITFATQGTSEGFDTGTWSWSTDGLGFTTLGGVNTASRSSYSLATADFSGITSLADASDAFFRYTLDGATSTSGNNRIDNFQINASPGASITAVPEPGSLAMLGVLTGIAAVGARRRRRPATRS